MVSPRDVRRASRVAVDERSQPGEGSAHLRARDRRVEHAVEAVEEEADLVLGRGGDRRDAARYLPKLQAALGDNFKYVIGVEDSDDYDWADEDEPYPDQQSEPASVPPLKPVPRPMLIYP